MAQYQYACHTCGKEGSLRDAWEDANNDGIQHNDGPYGILTIGSDEPPPAGEGPEPPPAGEEPEPAPRGE